MEFYIVDAFSHKAFGGNTAGVIMHESLKKDVMQSIASELRFSETAFVRQISDDTFNIKYFTPNSEIDLCGHATIASFKALLFNKQISSGNCYNLETLSGRLTVVVEENIIMMKQASPKEGLTIDDMSLLRRIADCLNIDSSMIGDENFPLKPQIISTGVYDIMLPVKNAEVLDEISPDFVKLSELSKELNVIGLHAFTIEGVKYLAKCRNFAPLYGINEEAATGTSNGALTYYLYKNNIISDLLTDYSLIQGEKMKRSSIITTRIIKNSDIEIFVGGQSHVLSKGELYI